MRRIAPLLVCCLLVAPSASGSERALSLADALTLARERNSTVRVAAVEMARAKLQVLMRQLAHVDIKVIGAGSAAFQWSSLQTDQYCANAPDQCQTGIYNVGATASLRIPLWTGLTLEANLAQARAHERSTHASRQAALRTLLVQVARAYWEVRRKELAAEIAGEMVRHFREFEQVTQERVRAGVAPAVDFNRARAATIGAETQVIALERDVGVGRAQLQSVLQVDEPLRLTDDPTRNLALLPPLDEAIREALASRPELAVARADTLAAAEGVRAAKGGYWPQLSVLAQEQISVGNLLADPTSYAASASQASTTSGAAAPSGTSLAAPTWVHSFYAGAQVNWNIFDMLDTWSKVKDAAFSRDRAQEEETRRRYDVLAEVRTAHAELRQALRAQEPAKQLAGLARANLELLRKRYSVGTGQLIDVLDAQDKALSRELDLIDRSVDLTEKDVELKAAMGRF
jgi:outer membrane protein TolC